MKKLIFACVALILACGCSDSGDVEGQPDTAVPNIVADSGIFGTWSFKTAQINTDCDTDSSLTNISESYKIEKVSDGCKLYSSGGSGSVEAPSENLSTVSKGHLFNTSETTCSVGGNVVVLEYADSYASENCNMVGKSVTRLELSNNTLNGAYYAEATVTGACSSGIHSCKGTAQLTATKKSSSSGTPTPSGTIGTVSSGTSGSSSDSGYAVPETGPSISKGFIIPVFKK